MDKNKLRKIKLLYFPYNILNRIFHIFSDIVIQLRGGYYISRNVNKIKKKQKETVNVVFMIQYVPSWTKVKSLYDYMVSDGRFKVNILCVPMEKGHDKFEKSDYSENATFDWFIDHGYNSAINALIGPNDFVSLDEIEADYFICTRPYDKLLPARYRSNELAKRSLLCYISYGANVSTLAIDVLEKSYYANVYKYYIDNNDLYKIFKRKLPVSMFLGFPVLRNLGMPVLENMLSEQVISSQKSNVCRILWTPRWATDKKVGGSNFFNYRYLLIDYVTNRENLSLIIRPHPLMFTNFIKTGEMTRDEVKRFISQIESTTSIKIDNEENYVDTLWNTDILVTDFSSITIEFFITKKPVIYCTSDVDFGILPSMQEMIDTFYVVNNGKELKKCLDDLII